MCIGEGGMSEDRKEGKMGKRDREIFVSVRVRV